MNLQNLLALINSESDLDFDISSVHVQGKQLFKMGSFSRESMPQLRGFAAPGSMASFMKADDKNKVNVAAQFLTWLESDSKNNVELIKELVDPSTLRGSQNCLLATKVAKHYAKMGNNANYRKFTDVYIVAEDGRLLDGHHGWAAVLLHNMLRDDCRKIAIVRVSMSIGALVNLARQFTNTVGLLPKEGL